MAVTFEQQQEFVRILFDTLEVIPLNQGIEPQILAAMDTILGGQLSTCGFQEDLQVLLSLALDIHSIRVREYSEKMDKRLADW